MARWRAYWVRLRSGPGDPIFLSPDYRVDPLLALYGQSAKFRGYTAETRRNYATDISLLLTFLAGRGRDWRHVTARDLEDYEHWRRFAEANPPWIRGCAGRNARLC